MIDKSEPKPGNVIGIERGREIRDRKHEPHPMDEVIYSVAMEIEQSEEYQAEAAEHESDLVRHVYAIAADLDRLAKDPQLAQVLQQPGARQLRGRLFLRVWHMFLLANRLDDLDTGGELTALEKAIDEEDMATTIARCEERHED